MNAARRILPIALLALWLLPASAQLDNGRFYGTITRPTGEPAEGVTVELVPTREGARVKTTTNKKGKFLLGVVRRGNYDLHVTAEGFVPRRIKAKALDFEKKLAWEVDNDFPQGGGTVSLQFDSGYDVTAEIRLASSVKVSDASGALMETSAEGALDAIRRKVEAGDCAGAVPELQALLAAAPDDANAHYYLGYCQASLGANEQALESLGRTLELKPDMKGVALLKAQVLTRMKRYGEAEPLLVREAENPDPVLRLQALIALGVIQRDGGRSADAAATFEKVRALDPDRPETYMELSDLYVKLGQPAKAEELLAQARATGHLDPTALLNLGITYMNQKDYPKAARTFQEIVDGSGDPRTLSMAWSLLARTQLSSGDTSQAAASLQKALELDPNSRFAAEDKEILGQIRKK